MSTDAKAFTAEDAQFAHAILAKMAFIRAFETKALELTQSNPPRVMGSMHFCAGQEAVPLGALAALREDDQIVATYRGHGWALAAGLAPRAVMAEICHRAEGVNGGRGGSAYILAPNTRFLGENSIVGAGTTAACGVAIANLALGNGRVVLVSIGDGALNQGATHEALAFAAARNLPVLFIVENNGWSELTPTREMFVQERLAQRASGYGIAGATISGIDPFAIRESVALAAQRARAGDGPSLLEFRVPRLWGHYNRDLEHYRSKADKLAAQQSDPLGALGATMVRQDLLTPADVAAVLAAQKDAVEAMTEAVMLSPPPDAGSACEHVIAPSFSGAPSRVLEIRELTYVEAVNAALRDALIFDPRTLVYGEDVGKAGGVFGATKNLQREFGPERVFDTPIAENAILGSALGAALSGMKPIVEIMWADFLFVALDQIANQAANIRYVTSGQSSAPMVVRLQQGATPGSCPQHSQSIEAILAHMPGIKVALAATADDAYSLLRAAVADSDPCVVIEARALYQTRSQVHIAADAETAGKARLRRPGADVAIVTWGTMVQPSLDAAQALATDGIEAAVLDLRWLNPLDEGALADIVRDASGRALIVHEAVRSGGFAGEIAFRLQELLPDTALTIRRLTTPDVRIPASPVLQAVLLPNRDTIRDAVKSLLAAPPRR